MNQDLRYLATEEKIRNAFFELLKTSSFEKMNVKMIVDQAGMNRTTFYLHYKDKYDLADTIENEFFEKIKGEILDRFCSNGEITLRTEVFSILTGYLEKNKETIMLLAGKRGDPRFLEKHFSKVGNTIGPLIIGSSSVDKYVIEGLKGMFIAFFKTWIRDGFAENPQEYAEHITHVIAEYKKLFSTI